MKNIIRALSLTGALCGALALFACEEKGTMEKAGEKVDEAAEAAKEEVEGVGEKVGKAMDDAKEAVENAGEEMEEAGEAAEESTH